MVGLPGISYFSRHSMSVERFVFPFDATKHFIDFK